MTDEKIIELYWIRSEKAIEETKKQYGTYLQYISFSVLKDNEDAEEIVNDTYLKVWNSIPPAKPSPLKAFLAKITRNLSINKLRDKTAKKRGGEQYILILDELSECISNANEIDDAINSIILSKVLNNFLKALSDESRRIFIKRYWYMLSVSEISEEMSISISKVKSSLMRTRKKLKEKLEEEGVNV